MSQIKTPSLLLIDAFKSYYRDMLEQNHIRVHDLYDDNIVFKDPIHEIYGLDNLDAYLTQSIKNLTECRFEFLDELIGDNSAFVKWHMHYLHPKISKKTCILRGVTHIHFEEKITYHEDIYDVGSLLYEKIPVLKTIIFFLKKNIAAVKK